MRLRGVIPVLPTAFADDESVDLAAVPRLVSFARRCGASAVCLPAYASEFYKLTDGERLELVGAAVDAAGGRIPVVAQANHDSARVAAELARRMEAAGADFIALALPRRFSLAEADLLRYAGRVLGAVGLPAMIQDFHPGGTSIGPEFCRALKLACPNFVAVKLEEPGLNAKAAAIREATDDGVDVLEGWGGLYMTELDPELVRGYIPGLGPCDALVRVHELLAGDPEAAFELHHELTPYLAYTLRGMESFHRPEKLTLQARGVLDSTRARDLTCTPDPAEAQYFARLLARLERTYERFGLSW